MKNKKLYIMAGCKCKGKDYAFKRKPVQQIFAYILCFLCILAIQMQTPEKVKAEENSIEYATVISANGSYSGRLSDGSEDYYKFTLNESAKITVTISIEELHNSGTKLSIYDNQYECLDREYIEYDGNRKCKYKKMDLYFSAGTYYFHFYHFTGTYSFVMESKSAGETFLESQLHPNDILSQAKDVSLDKKYAGLLGLGDEQDFYKFYVPFSGKVYISHYDYCGSGGTSKYVILDIEGNQRQSFTDYYMPDKGYIYDRDDLELEKGEYYLKVCGSYGFYNFTINIEPNPAQIAQIKRNKTKAVIKIEKQEGVTGYVIQYSTSDKFEKRLTKTETVKGTTVRLTGLKKKKTYYVRVKAYKVWNGETYYSKYGDIITMYYY